MMKKVCVYILLLATISLGTCLELYAQSRIRFAAGRSSATVTGTIPAKSNRYFVVRARAGQYARVAVSPGNLIIFSDEAPKGETGSSSFETAYGDNEFGIYNPTNRPLRYSLTISIR